MSDLHAALTDLASVCADLRRREAVAGAPAEQVHLAEGLLAKLPPLEVVVCGEYKRGKSTLLSALAGEAKLFAHDPKDTTSIATIATWGPVRQAVVTFGAGAPTTGQQRVIQLDQVQRYVTEAANRDNALQVAVVEMQAPLDNLRWGVRLVDTPGVNSRNPTHNLVTRECLNRADVILFVTSDSALSTLELEFVKEAAGHGARLMAILTKADQVNAERLRVNAIEKLSATLGRPMDVLAVSAILELEGLAEGRVALRTESRLPDLLERLKQLGVGHHARYAARAIPVLRRVVQAAHDLDFDEREVLLETQHAAGVLEQQLDQARSDLVAVDAALAEFHRDLADHIAGGMRELRDDLSRACEALIGQVKLARATITADVTPEEYQQRLFTRLADIADEADVLRDGLVNHIIDAAKTVAEVDLSGRAPDGALRSGLRFADVRLLPATAPRLSFAAVKAGLASGGKVATATGSVGGLIGGILASAPGAVAGTAIGALLGHLVGWVGGTVEAVHKVAEQQQVSVVQAMADQAPDWVKQAIDQIDDRFARTTTATGDHVRTEVDRIVAQRRGQLVEFVHRAERSRDRSGPWRADRLREIDEHLLRLGRLGDELSRLDVVLSALAECGDDSTTPVHE